VKKQKVVIIGGSSGMGLAIALSFTHFFKKLS